MKVGIIGAGSIVIGSHLPALSAIPSVSIAWVADRDTRRAASVARSVGGGVVAAPAELSKLPAADVVLLAAPYGVRAPYYELFAERGTALYVEKPFARTAREHDERCQRFSASRLACGFQRRSWGRARTMRSIVQSGIFGSLVGARAEMGGPGIQTGGRYSSDLDIAGGGILFEVGVHALDMALFCTDAERATTTSVEMHTHQGFDIHTDARIEVAAANENAFTLELLVTTLKFTRACNLFRFQFADVQFDMWGDGTIRVRPHRENREYLITDAENEYPTTSAQMFHAHWSQFLDACQTGVVNHTCAVTSRLTTAVVEDLYRKGMRG